MKIVIIGPGAMGCLFGGFLSLSGREVWFLDKNPERARRLEKTGIHLEGISGRHKAKVKATADPRAIGRANLIIIFVKSCDTPAVAENLPGVSGEDTPVLTLQNGLGNAEIISQYIGEGRTLAGVTSQGATLLGKGRVRHAGRGLTAIGWMGRGADLPIFDRDSVLRRIVNVFSAAGFETVTADNIEGLIWGKLIINAGINALTAVTRLPNGCLVEIEDARAMMHEAVKEAVSVASAKGIKLPYSDPIAEVDGVCRATNANISSMLQDVLHKKRTEVEAINGAIAREARGLNLAVPVNRLLTNLVRIIENSYSLQAI